MTSTSLLDREYADAKRVDEAVDAIVAGDLARAESVLLAVVANTPSPYTNSFETKEDVSIRFWDQAEFIHYIAYSKDRGLLPEGKSISWIPNAYPRAFYYLGFICVKRKQFAKAIEFLEKGQRLEPTQPMFVFEKAKALISLDRRAEALAMYDGVNELSPYVNVRHLAIARRGCGFVLIEQGNLDAAESSFNASLTFEPGNKIALNELQYIDHLRKGGVAGGTEVVPTLSPDFSECALCQAKITKGVVVSVQGMPVALCERCERKLTKKWWEFWK